MKKFYKDPKVQILLATYNGERFLQGQLDSIVNQEYKFWELLIHDDGSIDNTIKILKYYAKNYPKKIRLLIDQKIFSSASKNFFHLIDLFLINLVQTVLYPMLFLNQYWYVGKSHYTK